MMRKETYEHPQKKKKKRSRKVQNILNVYALVYLSKSNKEQSHLVFSPIISLIWGDWVLVGSRRKHSDPTSFLSSLPSQLNTPSNHFLSLSLLPKIISTKHTIKEKQSISSYFPLISSFLSLISLNPTILPRSSQLR